MSHNRSESKFSRRRLLRDAGLGAAMLPILSAPKNVWGATTYPKRLFIIVWADGVADFWPKEYSKTDETQFTLSEVTKPLEPHKKDINLIGGLDMTCLMDDKVGGAGRLHWAFSHILTGSKAFCIGGKGDNGVGDSISIDQHVATQLMKVSPTPIKSLELGMFKTSPYPNNRFVSYRGPVQNGTPQGNPPDPDPFKVYSRVFGAGVPGGAGAGMSDERLVRLRRDRKSIFDTVSLDLTALSKRLGTEDRQKIDNHMSTMRQVEKELDALQTASTAGVCAAPMMPDAARFAALKNAENVPAVSKLQIDLALAAMTCNLTRVVTYTMGDASNDELSFPWLGPQFRGKGEEYGVRSHHDISHQEFNGPDHKLRKILVDQWHMSQFAYVLDRMKQIPEGSGTMLDNSLVCMWNVGRIGSSHEVDRLPWVIGGRAGGGFKSGRYVKLGNWAGTTHDKGMKQSPHNALLAAIANAFDAPVTSFGDPVYGGEIPGIRG